MLVVDTKKNEPEGVRREYEHGVWTKIRPMTKAVFADLKRQATVKKQVFENGRRFTRDIIDEELLDKLMHRYAIEAWGGFVDTEGNPLPRTDENVDIVTSDLPGYANWVMYESDAIAEEEAVRKAGLLKNSSSSPGGTKTAPEA